MIGYNETFSKTKKAFKLVCGLKESKLSPKVLNYNYSAQSLNESKRVSSAAVSVMTCYYIITRMRA